jgi:hypothetical protein
VACLGAYPTRHLTWVYQAGNLRSSAVYLSDMSGCQMRMQADSAILSSRNRVSWIRQGDSLGAVGRSMANGFGVVALRGVLVEGGCQIMHIAIFISR